MTPSSASLRHELGLRVGIRVHRAELEELEDPAAAPDALLAEEHRAARVQLDRDRDQRPAAASSARSRASDADDVEARAWRSGRGARVRRADREQRHAADLVEGAGAVEELEQARHDVDGHAGVAADADAVQQLLVAGAREGDHHAVERRSSAITRRGPRACRAGQVGRPDLVGRRRRARPTGTRPYCSCVPHLLHELAGDDAGAEDHGRAAGAAARGGAWRARSPGRADSAPRCPGRSPPWRRPVRAFPRAPHAEQRPCEQHDGGQRVGHLAHAAGPEPQAAGVVEPERECDGGPGECGAIWRYRTSDGLMPRDRPATTAAVMRGERVAG